MKLGRLNHIGVATPSIADSVAYYRDTMGATRIGEPFDLPEQGVKVCFVDTPGYPRPDADRRAWDADLLPPPQGHDGPADRNHGNAERGALR